MTPDTPEKFTDLSYAQVVGTIILTHDYRLEHKEVIEKTEVEKKPKRKSITEKITQGIIRFFEEDTEMEVKKE